jgi:predicted DNA-binding transcriptional regulator AlpA
MRTFSTQEVAKKLGIAGATLSRYISSGKVPTPKMLSSGGMTIHAWTEEEIENVRKRLPKIANGRKTRYKKKQSAVSNQQSAKAKKKPQPRAAVPHKSRGTKKKVRTKPPNS